MQPVSTQGRFEELLSLEMIKKLHVNNIKQIESLKSKNKLNLWSNFRLLTQAVRHWLESVDPDLAEHKTKTVLIGNRKTRETATLSR